MLLETRVVRLPAGPRIPSPPIAAGSVSGVRGRGRWALVVNADGPHGEKSQSKGTARVTDGLS
jgi:hypothetical protein